MISEAEKGGMPIYVLRSSTAIQIDNFITDVFGLTSEEVDPYSVAMRDVQDAIQRVNTEKHRLPRQGRGRSHDFFTDHGFPVAEFSRLRIGPVIMKDELEYFREVGLLDRLLVTTSLSALSEDGSRFHIRNEFFREDRTLAARVTSAGGWLDLSARTLVAPPGQLLAALRSLPRAGGFQVLPSSVRVEGA